MPMYDVNSTVISGVIVEAEEKYTKDSKRFLSIQIRQRMSSRAGGDPRIQFIPVTLWGELAGSYNPDDLKGQRCVAVCFVSSRENDKGYINLDLVARDIYPSASSSFKDQEGERGEGDSPF